MAVNGNGTTHIAAIDRLLNAAVEDGRFQGLAFIAVDGRGKQACIICFVTSQSLSHVVLLTLNCAGRTIHSSAHGYRSFGSREEPMTIETAGWLASMTKLMTSVAAMQVVEKGLIGLDDDLSTILPELRDQKVLASFDATSGVEDYQVPDSKVTLRSVVSHVEQAQYPAIC